MQIASISFNGNGQKKKGIIRTTFESALSVGGVVAAGSTIGAAGGKLASFIPYTPKSADIKMQVQDLFTKAVKAEGNSPLIKGKKPLENIVKSGIGFLQKFTDSAAKAETAQNLYNTVAQTTDDVVGNEQIQNAIKEFFKETVPSGGYKKEAVLSKLKETFETALEESGNIKKSFDSAGEKFVELATKNDEIVEVAKKGAKHLRTTSFIGIGVAIGVLGALVLNIIRPNINFRKKAENQAQPN